MRANPPMIRFLASIGYTVHKVVPLVYNPQEIREAEQARAELRKIGTETKGQKDG